VSPSWGCCEPGLRPTTVFQWIKHYQQDGGTVDKEAQRGRPEKRKKKIFLILDNLPVHHSEKVKAWLVGKEKPIVLFLLPSYSPE